MRPGRFCIHISGSDCPVFKADIHILLHLGYTVDFYLQQIFHEDSFFWAFLQLHFSLGVLAEQVMDLLIVDFDEAASDKMRLFGIVLGDSYDLAEGAGNDTSTFFVFVAAHHRMRLTASRLAVCKYSSIIPI
jgi:hypothetical protein